MRARTSAIAGPARTAYLVIAWLLVGCLFVQFFLAGLGVFASPANFATHRDFAYLFGWLALINAIVAWLAGLPRRFILLALLAFFLMGFQSVFVLLRSSSPAFAALHPVNGVVITLISLKLALDVRAYVRAPLGTARDKTGAGG